MHGTKKFKCLILIVFALMASTICPALAQAESVKARYRGAERSSLRFAPIQLADGGQLTLISPPHFARLTSELGDYLQHAHLTLSSLLGQIPKHETEIRLMDEEQFFRVTGAPRWTNAMYYRRKIVIPIDPKKPRELSNLFRSVRHEYVHAVMNVLSAGRCPGWLDEGFAQWVEGEENPTLAPSLKRWLSRRDAIPLAMLQGGFTGLENEMVPPAYAQSLFASEIIMDKYGFRSMRQYLDLLRVGNGQKTAFQKAFGIDHRSFERKLESKLIDWKRLHRKSVSSDIDEARRIFARDEHGHHHHSH